MRLQLLFYAVFSGLETPAHSRIAKQVMIKPLSKEAIGLDFQNELSVQDYSKKPTIEGVQLINLNLFTDDGGCLAEIIRLDEN
ncbi:hypothetical protein ABTH73_19695, partial [Acinetobacter baumannii]